VLKQPFQPRTYRASFMNRYCIETPRERPVSRRTWCLDSSGTVGPAQLGSRNVNPSMSQSLVLIARLFCSLTISDSLWVRKRVTLVLLIVGR
jgi:hypothetical protein